MGGKKTACETKRAYGKAEMIEVILHRNSARMWLPVILNESRITAHMTLCLLIRQIQSWEGSIPAAKPLISLGA